MSTEFKFEGYEPADIRVPPVDYSYQYPPHWLPQSFTYRGWCMLCPVYLSPPSEEEIEVSARWDNKLCNWWLSVNLWVCDTLFDGGMFRYTARRDGRPLWLEDGL